MKKKTGYFITLEGGEGVGKSTQSKKLADAFRARGADVLETREPGGTVEAEKIRDLVLNTPDANWDPVSEALMMVAARHQHIRTKISPALASGKVVICDRFSDSTLVYQGYAGGLDPAFLTSLMDLVIGEFKPDLTLLFDMPVAESFKRVKRRNQTLDHFEGRAEEFHEKLRQGFLDLAKKDPKRFALLDSTQGIHDVFENIKTYVAERLNFTL